MAFEKNNPIAKATKEEEILSQKGKKDKKVRDPHKSYLKDSDMYIPNELALNDIEINMIAQSIHNARIIPYKEKESIFNKLKYMASEGLCNFFDKNLLITKEEKPNPLYTLFAEDMITVLTEQRPMIIEIENPDECETIEFNTYYVFSNSRYYELVGAQKNSDKAMSIFFRYIKSYKILKDKTFEKKPLKVDKEYFLENIFEELKAFPETFII